MTAETQPDPVEPSTVSLGDEAGAEGTPALPAGESRAPGVSRAPTELALARPTGPAGEAISGSALASTDSTSRHTLPPSLRDRYRDATLIGEGGMGAVLRAHDVRLGRDVAIKLLRRSDEGGARRFLQEARAQARVQHENVCPIYDAGEVSGQPYIVMQLLHGAPLDRAFAAGAGEGASPGEGLSLEEKVRLVRSACAAVHEAHRLGLIHRDLKPANILVERQADGSLKPYVVDFGLAREVEEHGHTVTGAVVGTPAYMSPEQAKGETRSLDRRTDVYSLGATLYKLVAGRTPFEADPTWKVLARVTTEDAPPLRSVKKDIPEDLDTIVMKCLEREPRKRYESARALGDDLQRFLDGEPISARRSWTGALWKKARRHKLATALSAAALISASALSGVWVEARRAAAEQARIAQEIGEDVKSMELFLRAAYGLPLHDVERERAVVRRRLLDIASRMQSSGKAALGPGNYALGRGHLALGDPETAREYLSKAVAAGYASPELSYALGLTLGEIYQREMARAERTPDDEERKSREASLRAELLVPALAALREASGATLEAPAYVEGLIAYHEGDHERALVKAREAFTQAPWLYEAKRLEGDVLAAMGRTFGHDAEMNEDKMMARLGPATEAYRAAAEMGRSDPDVHRAECEVWTRIALFQQSQGKSSDRSYERALGACDDAVAASPSDGPALASRAFALLSRAEASADRGGTDTLSLADGALEASKEAVRARPGDVLAQYDLARSAFFREEQRAMCGLDASTSVARAAYEAAISLDPRFTWAIAELGDVRTLDAELASRRGEDPNRSLDLALADYDRAMAADPAFTAPLGGKAHVHMLRAEDLLAHGQSPERAVADLLGVTRELEKRRGQSWFVAYWTARAHRLRARHALASGQDPGPSLRAALAALAPLGEQTEQDYWLLRERTEMLLIEAQHAVTTARDPAEPLARARRAARAVVDAKPMHVGPREILARLELVALRWALGRRAAREADFAAVLAPLQPLIEAGRADPRVTAVQTELAALRADFHAPGGR